MGTSKEINNNDLISVIPGQINVFEFLESKVIARREEKNNNNIGNCIDRNGCNYDRYKSK